MIVACPVSNPTWSDHTALLLPNGEAITYAQLSSQAQGVVIKLREQGVKRGHIVSLLEPNNDHLIATLLGLWRLGAVAQLLSTRLPPATREALEDHANWTLVSHQLGAEPSSNTNSLDIDLDQGATVMFTSGTTGTTKAVLHDYGNHHYSALGANENMPLKPGDRWLLSLPLFHVGGLAILFRCFNAGATVVLPRPATPLSELSDSFGITHLSVVPTQLRRLLADPPTRWPKAILVGGAALPTDLRKQVSALGLPVLTTYCLTESASQMTTSSNPEHSGYILPHRELKISADGEILIRGPVLFRGYRQDDQIDPARDEDGWFHTGDLGSLDDGALSVLGRKDNMFISGGENIQPEEIEAILLSIPGVEEAVVVPVADVEYGQRPAAFVGGDWDVDELRQQLADKVPAFKIPVSFQDFPHGVGEGIKRHRAELRDWLAAD